LTILSVGRPDAKKPVGLLFLRRMLSRGENSDLDSGSLGLLRSKNAAPISNRQRFEFKITFPRADFMSSDQRVIRNDIIAIGLMALIIFLLAAIFTYDAADPVASQGGWLNGFFQTDQTVYPEHEICQNMCGVFGAWTAEVLFSVLGLGVYLLIAGLVALEIALFQRSEVANPWIKILGWGIAMVSLCSLAATMLPGNLVGPLIGSGGYLGALGAGLIGSNLGTAGTLIMFTAAGTAGMMMWTEYLAFRAGRFVFAPAIVAATAVLPFGLLHGFVSWFNSEATEEELDDEYEDAEETLDEDDETHTIKFRRRDMEPTNSEEDEDDAEVDDEEWEDEESEEEELDDEFEDVEETTAQLNIGDNQKTPVPALEPGDQTETNKASLLPKPHFRLPKRKQAEPPKKLAAEVENAVAAIAPKAQPPAKPPSERELVMKQLNAASEAESHREYHLPPIEMLERGVAIPLEKQRNEALRRAKILEQTCEQFGYKIKVVEIESGPVISQYEIDLEPGLRLQKIVNLADDLAVAMRVSSVRIVAPIPGKNSVGVEVPNETRKTVHMREVMEQCSKQIKKMKVPLFLGSDAVGAPLIADLAKLPHLLIAGRTGTGKSVCLNAIICSILMTRTPDEVRMLMIDPKMVEMSGYGSLPHLMHPVVTDMRKAEAILAWAVDKMEERYKLLASAGVRHVTSYNELSEEELFSRIKPTEEEKHNIPKNLPFIVIVADEMADLMMTSGKEVEQHIIRLAQKSRAVGIHLILATQKPTVDVITGLIKSNLPARISFQVASKTDSRVVLDAMGADKLLGLGDMLFLWPGTSNLLRGQGTFLSDAEIDKITAAVSTEEQNFVDELMNIKVKKEGEENEEEATGFNGNKDELYEKAIDVVVDTQRGSLSMLQRALGIGYGRAARLVDFMAEDGYVGPYNGSKSREVLLTAAAWAAMKSGGDVVEGTATPAAKATADPTTATPEQDTKSSLADEILQEILGEADAEEAKVTAKPLKPLPKASSRSVSVSASVSPALAVPEEELEDKYEEEEEEVDVENELEDYMTEDEVEASAADEEFEDEEYEEEDEELEDGEEEDDEEYEYVDEDYDEDEYEDVE
jgi:S-DNA-T family DNA segregation ATPase FtsK/SpoIIIE